MLQGTVTGNQVTLTAGNGALTINATASGTTLSGTLTCGLTSGPFTATLIDITGQWTGTFLATQNTGFANTIGAKTNVTINITQNPHLNSFPTFTGTATFTTQHDFSVRLKHHPPKTPRKPPP